MVEFDVVPPRSLMLWWMYRPERLLSGEIVFWNFALLLLDMAAPLLRYRARWQYASVRPTRKHQRTGPRHAAPTTLFQQIGWTKRLGALELWAMERVDATAKTA